MKLWWSPAESNLDRHLRQHEELLRKAKKIAEEAKAQEAHLVSRANGHLAEFEAELGEAKNAGKS